VRTKVQPPSCEGSFIPAVSLEFEDVDGYREIKAGRCAHCGWRGRVTAHGRTIWRHREVPADERVTRIVITPWDPDSDMAIVTHDGELVWQDSMSSFDQYLRHFAPQGRAVILEVRGD
jgi:hypothetical protein